MLRTSLRTQNPAIKCAHLRDVQTGLFRRQLSSTITRHNSQNVAPQLNGLEARWPKMKEADQEDVIDYLSERATHDWKELTLPEKRALYYIYFGNWGPRSDTQSKSTSQLILGALGGGITLIALGVAVMNYAYDLEREEKTQLLGKKIEEELKRREEAPKKSKSWFHLWS